MVQAARRQDDGEYVTKGEFRAAIADIKDLIAETTRETNAGVSLALQAVDRAKDDLIAEIKHNRTLYELILDDIRPNWRSQASPPDDVSR